MCLYFCCKASCVCVCLHLIKPNSLYWLLNEQVSSLSRMQATCWLVMVRRASQRSVFNFASVQKPNDVCLEYPSLYLSFWMNVLVYIPGENNDKTTTTTTTFLIKTPQARHFCIKNELTHFEVSGVFQKQTMATWSEVKSSDWHHLSRNLDLKLTVCVRVSSHYKVWLLLFSTRASLPGSSTWFLRSPGHQEARARYLRAVRLSEVEVELEPGGRW